MAKTTSKRNARRPAGPAGNWPKPDDIGKADTRPAAAEMRTKAPLPPDREAELMTELRRVLGDYLRFGNGAERRFSRVIDIMDDLDGTSYRKNSNSGVEQHDAEYD